MAALYFADEHTLQGLGLKLIAGRNFTSADVVDKAGYTDLVQPSGVIITRVLAEKLYPKANAVGQSIYDEARHARTPIIGIIDKLQVPWVQTGGWGEGFFDNSILEPFHLVVPRYVLHRARQARPDCGRAAGGAQEAFRYQPLAGHQEDPDDDRCA